MNYSIFCFQKNEPKCASTSQDDLGRSSPERKYYKEFTAEGGWSGTDSKATTVDNMRPLKYRRTEIDRLGQTQTGLRATSSVVESLKRFRRQDIGELSGESGAIDLNSSDSPSHPI